MVIPSENDIKIMLRNCGLDDKYPLLRTNIDLCITTFVTEFKPSSDYQTFPVEFMIFISRYRRNFYGNISWTEFIDKICVGAFYKFKVYHEHNINDFIITNFVTNFCSKNINDILEIFDDLNMKHNISIENKNNPEINDNLVKMFNCHLLMMLGNIFARFNFCIKYDYFAEVPNKLLHFTKHCLDKNIKPINYIMIDKIIIKISESVRKYRTMTQNFVNMWNNETSKKFINDFYEMHKETYDWFQSMDSEKLISYINSIPDLEVLYRIDTKKIHSRDLILNTIVDIDYMFIVHIIDTTDSICKIQCSDLVIPTSAKIDNILFVIDV
jgi:hypothetical protein